MFLYYCSLLYVYPLVDQLPVRSPTSKGRESMESGGVKNMILFLLYLCVQHLFIKILDNYGVLNLIGVSFAYDKYLATFCAIFECPHCTDGGSLSVR